jgi:hypothetical protein
MRNALRYSLALAALSFATSSSIPACAQTPQEYPMWCQGATGLATASGQGISVYFLRPEVAASQSLRLGTCSWVDRPLRQREPNQIIYQVPAGESARDKAKAINAGGIWTFWAYNAGRFMTATAVAPGAQTVKP